MAFHAARQQKWDIGATVRVGFLSLRIVNLIPTHFTPHFSLERA